MRFVILRSQSFAALIAACLCGFVASRPSEAQAPQVDAHTLPRLLRARGFAPTDRFKALIIVLPPSGSNDTEALRIFDYNGTSDDRDDWWPASSVKLFVAVAALERTHALGFSPRASATFEWEDGSETSELRQIVWRAIVPSDNDAYNQLADIVGLDGLNRDFFTRRNGLEHTVLLRRFTTQTAGEPPHGRSLRNGPAILLREGTRQRRLAKRIGRGQYTCAEEGNCTTLRDLAEAMRRVMLHEALPADQRFALGEAELALLRSALEAERPRGNELPRAIREGYGSSRLRIHHKPGYAYRWISDVMFIHDPDRGTRFIVAAANRPGRRSLDAALRHIGAILASPALVETPR